MPSVSLSALSCVVILIIVRLDGPQTRLRVNLIFFTSTILTQNLLLAAVGPSMTKGYWRVVGGTVDLTYSACRVLKEIKIQWYVLRRPFSSNRYRAALYN